MWCYFALLGLSSPSRAPTGLCWCCLNRKMLPQAGPTLLGKDVPKMQRALPGTGAHVAGCPLPVGMESVSWTIWQGPFCQRPSGFIVSLSEEGTFRPHAEGDYLLVWYCCYG